MGKLGNGKIWPIQRAVKSVAPLKALLTSASILAGTVFSTGITEAQVPIGCTLDPQNVLQFDVPAGDVDALIAAINDANSAGAGIIHLEGGTYTLTEVGNTIEGANGLPSITSPICINGTGAGDNIIQRDPSAFSPGFRRSSSSLADMR